MRQILLAGVALATAAAAAGQGGPGFEFHRELAQGKRLYVQNIIGDMQVSGGPGRAVEVTAVMKGGRYGSPGDVTVEVIELDNGVALCVRYPRQRGGQRSNGDRKDKNPCSWGEWNGWSERNDTKVNFTIRVPAGLDLHVGTVSGDLVAENLEGELDLHSVSGDARLSGGRGQAITVETVSGSVELLDVRAKEVYGTTVSGEVTFRGPILDNGTYEFTTTSGDISLGIPERPNATLSAATFSGRFSSDIATTLETGRHRHRYSATWGSGTAHLEVESLSGDIRITSGTR